MNEVFIEKAEVLRRFLQRSREEKKQVDMGLQTAHQLVSVIEFRPQVGTICGPQGGYDLYTNALGFVFAVWGLRV